jgi:hypothetical protein
MKVVGDPRDHNTTKRSNHSIPKDESRLIQKRSRDGVARNKVEVVLIPQFL